MYNIINLIVTSVQQSKMFKLLNELFLATMVLVVVFQIQTSTNLIWLIYLNNRIVWIGCQKGKSIQRRTKALFSLPFTPQVTLTYKNISAGAMKALYAKGIVHRDLKPQNILLSHSGAKVHPQPSEIKLKIGERDNIFS